MQKRMQFLKNEMVRIWEFYILYYNNIYIQNMFLFYFINQLLLSDVFHSNMLYVSVNYVKHN